MTLGLGAGLLAWALAALGLLSGLEDLTWDWRARVLARPAASTAQVVTIGVDQDSLDWASANSGLSWPWPRQVYAPILQFLARGGAQAVALDIIFSEPSALEGDDQALAQALAGPVSSLGAVMLGRQTGQANAWPPALLAKTLDPGPLAPWPQEGAPGLVMTRALLPTPEVAQGFALLGNVTASPDPDQVIRRLEPLRFLGGRALASLGLAAACAGGPCALTRGPGWLSLGGHPIPVDPEGRAILRFRGPPGTHPRYSAAAVLRAELALEEGQTPDLDPAQFRGRYVFLGLTAPGLHDLRATPVSPLYPGLEVHATALDNLLAGDFLRPAPPWGLGATLLLLGPLAGLAGLWAARPWQGLLALALLTPLPLAAGFGLYQAGWWWPVAAPCLAVALSLVAVMALNYAGEGRQRRFIKRAFHHYLSPQVIEQILADPSRLSLGGERRELTIFFADLQGFTSISEGLDPQDLASLLNDYLSDMTEVILAEGGTLDKYEGDAIVAFWNAPLDQPDHALRACRAALGCHQRLRERQAHYAQRAGRPLFMRVGLNTGPVVVGNLGSRTRFDYTVLGDAANLASRLEGANKLFGTGLMVSLATWEQTHGALPGRQLGRLKVVGRAAPVQVFQPLEATDPAPPPGLAPGLALLEARDWAGALAFFAALEDRDSAAKVYAARCRELMALPQPQWDGVWNLQSK